MPTSTIFKRLLVRRAPGIEPRPPALQADAFSTRPRPGPSNYEMLRADLALLTGLRQCQKGCNGLLS